MVNLIPFDYLNEACFLSVNMDKKKYQMVLRLAQKELKGILGTEFYTEIETQYPSSLSADNATLYEDYIKDYLAWETYHQHLKFSQSDSTPSGERQFSDENSEILGDFKLYTKEKNIINTVNSYRNDMINYLMLAQANDSTKYPKWIQTRKPVLGFGITNIIRGNKDATISVNRTAFRNE